MRDYSTEPHTWQERGNILFLILLAVILFAALSYAVIQSMRGGGKNASDETNSVLSSQIVQHASLIENTLLRQKIASDIPEYGFDLSDPATSTATTNATCTQQTCRLFYKSATPGLMSGLKLPAKALASGTGLATFRIVSVQNIGTSADDLILMYNGISTALCNAINKQLGITYDLITPEVWGGSITNYSGTMTAFPAASGSTIGDEVPAFAGQNTGCFYHATGGNIFYHVIMPR